MTPEIAAALFVIALCGGLGTFFVALMAAAKAKKAQYEPKPITMRLQKHVGTQSRAGEANFDTY